MLSAEQINNLNSRAESGEKIKISVNDNGKIHEGVLLRIEMDPGLILTCQKLVDISFSATKITNQSSKS